MMILALAAVPTAVSLSRDIVRFMLGLWGLTPLAETARLVVSELVTNAVKTTGTMDTSTRCAVVGEISMIQVRLVLARGSVFVDVWDRDVRTPVTRNPDPGEENGRGMLLVDAVSRRWGFHHPRSGGKFVWCELAPETERGLPVRVPSRMRARPLGVEPDVLVLRRVIDRLRRLQVG
jgi:hypothetical protein